MIACTSLTPETATKLLLTRPGHSLTYTYARELPGSSSPYRVRCSCGHDFGWLRATLRAILPLALAHVASPGLDLTSATRRHADPRSAPECHSPSRGPLASGSVASPALHSLPPCALEADSPYANALAWVSAGD